MQLKNKGAEFSAPLLHFFHWFAAATGNDFTGFDFQGLAADGAIDGAVFLCPDYQLRESFCVHDYRPIISEMVSKILSWQPPQPVEQWVIS